MASYVVNGLIFGSAQHEKRPLGGVLENYKHCASDDFERNMITKVCVRPKRVIGFRDPHVLLDTFTVDTDGKKVNSPRCTLPNDRSIRIHHYFLKSYEEFERKANKGFNDRIDCYPMDIFEYYDRNECYNNKAWQIMKNIWKEE